MNKFNIVIAIMVFGVCTCKADKEEFHKNIQKCVEETNVKPDEMSRFKDDNFEGATPEFKCFISCFLKQTGAMENGVPNPAKMKEFASKMPNFNSDNFDKASDECMKKMTGADECEKAFNFASCHKTTYKGLEKA